MACGQHDLLDPMCTFSHFQPCQSGELILVQHCKGIVHKSNGHATAKGAAGLSSLFSGPRSSIRHRLHLGARLWDMVPCTLQVNTLDHKPRAWNVESHGSIRKNLNGLPLGAETELASMAQGRPSGDHFSSGLLCPWPGRPCVIQGAAAVEAAHNALLAMTEV